MSIIERLNAALSGRYRIERELGEGGMATVYLADDVRHERRVALKVLKPELAAVVGAERFLAEIRTTANLQHPHILPLFDSGEADGFLYYVMPYIEGETLRDRLDRERQLPVDEALGIATAVANALQTAHEQGVVHRDIKPANILLSRGEPLVADFGIALAVSAGGGGRLTETGLSLGTPYYMSPEQATGDQTVGPASDVFALGCVLYEMLIGEPPYPGSTAQAVLGKIIQAVPVSATAQRATVPAHVDAAILKALEKLPADRFTRARDFAAALADRGFRHGSAEVTASAGAGGPWNRLSAGLAGLLAVASMLAIWGWLGNGSPPAAPEPPLHLNLDLGGLRPTRGGDEVIISPDGSSFAFGTDLEGPPRERVLMYRSAQDLTFRPIPGTEGVSFSYAFSPDGESIAFMRDGDIMKVSLRGGTPATVASVEDADLGEMDWGAEGWIVFLHGEAPRATEVFRVPESGGAAERLVGPPYSVREVSLLPDGSGVLFDDRASGQLALYDFDTDSVQTLPLHGYDPMYVASGHLVHHDGSGGLWAAPFDLARRTLTGEAKPILQGVYPAGSSARYGVSRGGTLVYENDGGASREERDQRRLVVVALQGGEEVLPLEPRFFREPRWGPDGRRVAYTAGDAGASLQDAENVYVYDAVVRGAPRRITSVGENTRPVWSPDGRHLAFSSEREGGDGSDLYVQALDGGEPARRVVSLPGFQFAEDWTSRGLLLFNNGAGSLWVVDPLADEPVARPYLESEYRLNYARVSPDGSLVAYASNESGTPQVYVRSFPDPGPPLLVSGGEGDATDPGWSPDGRTVYYRLVATGGEWILATARLGSGSPLTVASRDTVRTTLPWGFVSWDMHPDGTRFITSRGEDRGAGGAEPRRTIVVVNWFDELRRRMGEGG